MIIGTLLLQLAIGRNELEVFLFLLSQEADITIENGDGKAPLELAEKCNHVDIIKVLKGCTSQKVLYITSSLTK